MRTRMIRWLAVLTAAILLAGCSFSIDEISIGNRRVIRADGEDVQEIDLLLFAEQAGDHTLSIEGIHFVNGGIELTIDPALEDNITMSAPQVVMDTIKVKIDHENGVIAISGNEKLSFSEAELEITVGVPVKSLSVEGGVEVDAVLPEVKDFVLDVAGAVDGEIQFGSLEALDVEIDGAGSLELLGRCGKAEVTVNGAGSIDAETLICTEAEVTINGAGSCKIHVTDTLDAEVNGVGSVRYFGKPQTVNRAVDGLGTVSEG